MVIGAIFGITAAAQADNAQYFYDPSGQLLSVLDPVNGTALYNYDAAGNLLSVKRNPTTTTVVAQVAPNSGPTGTVVTIYGTGFGTTSNTSVSFNGSAAAPTAVTSTQITVVVPSGAATGTVSVTAPGGTASSAANFVVTAAKVPTLAALPTTAVNPGSTLTLTGTNFDPNSANDKIFINGRFAGLTSATATSLVVTVPAVTSGPVTVETSAGQVTSSANLIVPPSPYLASNVKSVIAGVLGRPVTGSVSGAGKISLVLFTASAGQRLSMQVTQSSFASGFGLQLYAPDGLAVGVRSDISNGSFVDVQALSLSGVYTVVMTSNDTAGGSATVNLFNVPADATATIAANGQPMTLATTTPGQNMALTFSGTAGQRINLETQTASSSGQYHGCSPVTILEPDGQTQLYSNLCFNDAVDYSGALVLPSSGTYQILFNSAADDTGAVAFTLYTVPADATATIAANGQPMTLTTTTPGQNMALTFSGTAGQRINLETQTASSSGQYHGCSPVTILEPDGQTQLYSNLCFNDAVDYSGALVLPSSGTYQILFNSAAGDTGAVAFTLYTVPADATATIAANGQPMTLTTTTPGQNMALTFSGTAGQRINLETQTATSSGQYHGCSPVTILEPDGQTQLYSNLCFNDAVDYSGALVLPSSGTYQILFNSAAGDTGAVAFTLYTVPADATATIAANGQPMTLATTTPGQNMALTFSGTAGQRVNLEAQTTSSSGQYSGCSPMTILEPDGQTQLYSAPCFNADTSYSDVLVLPSSGTYQILFDPYPGDTGAVAFTLYAVPADAAATVTAGGGTVSLTTAAAGQNMTLTFSGTQGSRVSLYANETNGLGDCGDSLTVTAPDGATQLFNTPYCSSVFTGTLPSESPITSTIPTLPTSGTYTILLNPANGTTGTAAFTLYAVPADASGVVTMGAAAKSFSTTAPSQAIRATFTGGAGGSATIAVNATSVTPLGGCYYVSILEPDGSTVLRGDASCSSGYSSGSLSLPASGTYTIVVNAADMAVGTYTVGVSTP